MGVESEEKMNDTESVRIGIGFNCFLPIAVEAFNYLGFHYDRVVPDWNSTISAMILDEFLQCRSTKFSGRKKLETTVTSRLIKYSVAAFLMSLDSRASETRSVPHRRMIRAPLIPLRVSRGPRYSTVINDWCMVGGSIVIDGSISVDPK